MTNLISDHLKLDEQIAQSVEALTKGVKARLMRVNAEIRLARYKENKNHDWLHLRTQLEVLKTRRREIDQMLSRILNVQHPEHSLAQRASLVQKLTDEFRQT